MFQDEVRLRLFLDSIGLSDLSAKEIKKWMPEDRRQFELIQERFFLLLLLIIPLLYDAYNKHHNASIAILLLFVYSYIREKEMEEEALMQRREEEGKGRERRRALLEREERKWKELEISLLSSIPNTGSRDAAAMAAAVRAVGGESALEDSFARDRVSSIANHIRKAQLARRAEQVLNPDYP